ncbi:MAG: thiamine phosphate synthase [Acidobacteriota bacterium]|nr:thiamine phosphate synthase [Acidobacteriota bacterium]
MKGLYVTDRRAMSDARFEGVLQSLTEAPLLTVQLREKGTPDRQTLAWAAAARRTLGSGVALYVNRRFDLALAAGAEGVHLPSDGLPLARVRANTPRGFRVGISTHSAAEAEEAISGGADLVVIGPLFSTPSKAALGEPLGPEALADLPPAQEHRSDVFAIGGISEENLDLLEPYRNRISGVAGIRLFQDALDPGAVARRIAGL